MRTMNLRGLPHPPVSVEECVDLYLRRLEDGRMLFPDVSNLLLAYAAWPSDSEARDRYMATNLALFVAQEERTLATGSSNAQPMGSPYRTGFELFGGLQTGADASLSALLDQLEKIQGQWPRVADVFQMIVDIAHETRIKIRGGTSISKAF